MLFQTVGLEFMHMLMQYFLRKGIGMSMNKTKTLFEKMFGLKISKAEIHLMTLRIASLLKDKYFELIKQLRNSEFVHFDETGWRIDGKNYWLWTFTNGEITIYPISKKRNKKIPEKILGKKELNSITSKVD
jgi:transposase